MSAAVEEKETVDPKVVASAKEYIKWEPHALFREQVEKALKEDDTKTLNAMFAKRIAFGTAGLRSVMKGGYANMNDLVIIQTCQGLCQYSIKHVKDCKQRGVIIGYDGRYHSERFAKIAASVFRKFGFTLYLFDRLAATPFIPFGILRLKCALGIVVTASHNPKLDNGFKVYWENGSQIIPPHDEGIAAAIENDLRPWHQYKPFDWDKDCESPKERSRINVTESIPNAYFETIQKNCYHRDDNKNSKLKVTFTPMHGVGGHWMRKAYEAFNHVPFIPVKEQIEPDPEFSTVEFPNPEEGAGALALAMKTADANGSPLILANDPDSDRLAVAEKMADSDEWNIFNGNQIAILLSDWVFRKYLEKNPNADVSKLCMVASTVSSKYLQSMASHHGFQFHDTLTGFKWMGNKAVELVSKGNTFLFAYEVEIGFTIGDALFDKDGINAGVVFNEMASQLYAAGQTCAQKMAELRGKYGYYEMTPAYRRMDDAKLMGIFAKLRDWDGSGKRNYPTAMGKFKIRRVRDVTTGFDNGEKENRSQLPVQPNHQMLTFWFENGATATMRNSGTEPKLKFYVEAKDDKDPKVARSVVDEMVASLLSDFMQMK